MKTTKLKLGLFALGLFTLSQVNAQDQSKAEIFKALDADTDEKLTLEEFSSYEIAAQEEGEEIYTHETLFAKLDEDGDGSLTLEEFVNI